MDNKLLNVLVLLLILVSFTVSAQNAARKIIPQTTNNVEQWENRRKELIEEFKKRMPVRSRQNAPSGSFQDEENRFRFGSKKDRSTYISPPDLYRLKIGDQLRVTVYGKETLNRIVTIDNYGLINFNYINTVHAAGKSIPELQYLITEKLNEYFKHIDVIIAPHIMRSQYYTIAGSILSGGQKGLSKKTTLLEAISEAGGLMNSSDGLATIQLTDLERSFIIRNNNYLPVSFDRLILHGDMKHNITLESGDFIYLPYNTTKRVYILGEVNQARYLQLRTRTTLIQVISHAQGRTDDASNNVVIIRGTLTEPKTLKVNFADILAGKAKDVYLKSGDIVYVPARNFIFGEELLESALNTFVLRIASEAGSETFRQIHDTSQNNPNDFIFYNSGGSPPPVPSN